MREKYYLKINRKAFLYPEDFLKIKKVATTKQLFTINSLLQTGARINELRHVTRENIDDQRQTITLLHTKVRARLKEHRSSPRIIPISTDFYNYFRLGINKYKFLSTNQTGLVLKKLAKDCNISYWQDLSAHNLRKTFGTWMLSVGVDGFKLAQHLGHSPEMLRTSYASPDIFISSDKDIIRQVLGNLPDRLRKSF